MLGRPKLTYSKHFVRPCSGRRCLRRPPRRIDLTASRATTTRHEPPQSPPLTALLSFPSPAIPPEMPVRASLPLSLTPSRVVVKPS